MAVMKRYRVTWSGSPVVGPSISTFYESPESGVGGADALETFFAAIADRIALNVQIVVPSSGDLIESTTGDLVGTWSDPGTGGTVSTTSPGAASIERIAASAGCAPALTMVAGETTTRGSW